MKAHRSHMGSPISSDISISETALGEKVYAGTAGGGKIASTKDGVGGGNKKSTLFPHTERT